MSTLPDLPSMMKTDIPMEYFDAVAEYATAFALAAIASERERCAKVCEAMTLRRRTLNKLLNSEKTVQPCEFASAIRALPERGEGS